MLEIGENGQIVCPNCGAGFSVEDARCPYCGALNPSGAEKAYMDALADIKDDTDELADDTQDDLKSNIQRNVKRTIAIIVIAAAVLAALFATFTCMDKRDEQQALKDFQAREAFKAQHFEELERLYEAEDDDALSDYVWNLVDEPGFDALFSWKHADFLEVHDDWETLKSAERDIAAGTCDIDEYTWLVMCALRLAQFDADDTFGTSNLSAEEEERAAGYRAYAHQFLQSALQMSDEEIASFADAARDSEGFIQQDVLKRNLEEHLKQRGIVR